MEKIKLGLFDLFAYILPGFFVVLTLYCIINPTYDVTELIIRKSTVMNVTQVVLFVLTCYLLGFLNQYISYEVFKILSKVYWPKRLKDSETSFGKLEYVIVQIRHYSPNNFDALNKWLALRSMCYGLFQSIAFFVIVLYVLSVNNSNWSSQRILLLLVLSIMAILFLRRSITFHEWAHSTIKHTKENINDFKASK